MLDFTEISSGKVFEDLVEELLFLKGMDPKRSGEGPDGGRDFLATEVLTGQFAKKDCRKWVVECKHYAISKRSVSEHDIGSISGIISKHHAQGFLLITSTRLTINLEESIRAINNDPLCHFSANFWTDIDLERELIDYPDLVKKYFPLSYAASLLSSPHLADLITNAKNALDNEIRASVGKKYIPEIYVERSIKENVNKFLYPINCKVNHILTLSSHLLDVADRSFNSLSKHLTNYDRSFTQDVEENSKNIHLAISVNSLNESINILQNNLIKLKSELKLLQLSKKQKTVNKKSKDARKALKKQDELIRRLSDQDKKLLKVLKQFNILKNIRDEQQECNKIEENVSAFMQKANSIITSIKSDYIPFPSTDLLGVITEVIGLIKKSINSFKKLNEKISIKLNVRSKRDCDIKKLEDDVHKLEEKWRLVRQALRPVYLLIDRAGGGKTNLLCRLAYEISNDSLCFFVAAKSILDVSQNGIIGYINNSYRLCSNESNSIKIAEEWCSLRKKTLIFIIDGINESTNPTEFNQALKNLIKKYYDTNTRFLISCRDVYWEYFNDDFWKEHGEITKNTLYTFTVHEHKKALPLYLKHFHITGKLKSKAKEQLRHPLLLRFFCEAYKGMSEDKPTNIQIDNIRLKLLFEKYSERKFFEICKRLQLTDSSEIEKYLFMIVRLMLKNGTRLVASKEIAGNARKLFGETSITRLDSKYMQIRDEDIIIDQKPVGKTYSLQTEFVYDEFMEYVIARSTQEKIEELVADGKTDLFSATNNAITELLNKRHKFISVVGGTEYLITFIAEQNIEVAHKILTEMVKNGFENIVCRAISKWPRELVDTTIYKLIIHIHSKVDINHDVEQLVWRLLEDYFAEHPKLGSDYITNLKLSDIKRPSTIFSFIARVAEHIEDAELLSNILLWIVKYLQLSPSILIGEDGCGDFISGILTISVLAKKLRRYVPEHQRTQLWYRLEPILKESANIKKFSVSENLRTIFLNVKNRSKSYHEFKASWI